MHATHKHIENLFLKADEMSSQVSLEQGNQHIFFQEGEFELDLKGNERYSLGGGMEQNGFRRIIFIT